MDASASFWRSLCWAVASLAVGLGPTSRALTPVDPALPVVTLTATRPQTSEPIPAALIAPGEFTVGRRGPSETPLTVVLAYGGSASVDDYEQLPDSVVIPAGEASARIQVIAKSDDLVEGTETVVAKVLQVPNADGQTTYIVSPEGAGAEIRIADEDKGEGLPLVGIKTIRGETIEPSPLSRVAPGEFVVYRDGSASDELSVYLQVGGSATPGKDYEALDNVIHFAAGETEVRLVIGAYDDSLAEGDETVALELTAPPTAALPQYAIDPAANAAKLIIHDNDLQPHATVKITDPPYGAQLRPGSDVEVEAVAVDPQGYIPTLDFYLDDSLLGTSTVTFIRAPDPGTPVYHKVLWKNAAPGKHELVARGKDSHGVVVSSEPVIVVVAEVAQETLVSIVATDPQGTEFPAFVDAIDPITFEITRSGPTAGSLIVFFSLHGTASAEDYFEVPTSVIIPDGSTSARLQIVPKADLLEVVEPTETVGVRLEPSPVAGPLRTYGIDPAHAFAAGVIFERQAPQKPVVELAFPDQHESFEWGEPIDLLAVSVAPEGTLVVEFYDGEAKIGSASGGDTEPLPPSGSAIAQGPEVQLHSFEWKAGSIGEHSLTARAILADGSVVSSQAIPIMVKRSVTTQAYIKILEPGDGQTFPEGGPINITAVAVDPEGYIPRVEFLANDRQIGVSELAFFRAPDPGTPITHNFVWEKAEAGTYVITVRGLDSHGNPVVSFPVKITVGGTGGSEASIEIVSPSSGEIFEAGANIPMTAIATDPKGYIPRVEFYANEQLIGVSEIAFFQPPAPGTPITHQKVWENVPAGEYVLTARGLDAQGQTIVSSRVKITVGRAAAEAKIVIVTPKSGETFRIGSDIPITAVATDPDGAMTRVEFYANDKLIGVSEIVFIRAPDPGIPLTHTKVWENAPAGEYVLTARSVDANGHIVVSSPVNVRVIVGGPAESAQVVLTVEAADPYAAENTESGDPDNAVFVIRRIAGASDVEVPVFFTLSGTAVNGVDYTEVKDQLTLPAGAESAEVVIKPIPDKALEGDETVEITLVPPVCPAIFPPPPQCYMIAKSGAARAVIREQSSGGEDTRPKLAIVPRSEGSQGLKNAPLEFRADAAVTGKPCVLETSVDLRNWSEVAPVYLPDGQLTYVMETGADSHRYYRLRIQ